MKANHPHNSKRPEPKRVRDALESKDMEMLALALSPRQRSFAREYVVDYNGAAAVIRAGYSKNYPEKMAYLLLRNKGIATLIEHLNMSKEAKVTSIDPEYVLSQVTAIITNPSAKDGDKLRGLELLARHLGMFVDRTEISGKDGEAIKYQEVESEANDFTRKILNLQKKNKAAANLKVVNS